MTKIYVLLSLCLCCFSVFGQNRSNGGLTITSPIAIISGLPSGVEAFRFRPGLITQSDFGTFNFSSTDQWLSFGKLTTPSATLYGYRAQRAGRGLIFGYKGDIQTSSPTLGNAVIEWVGNGLVDAGDLTFRTSNSSTSGISFQVSRMRSDGTTVFGQSSVYDFQPGFANPTGINPQLEVNSTVESGVGIVVTGNSARAGETNFKTGETEPSQGTAGIFTQKEGDLKTGIIVSAANPIGSPSPNGTTNTAMLSRAGGAAINFGLKSEVSSTVGNNYGLFSSVVGNTAPNSINYGIFSSATGNGALAAFFNGNVLISSGSSPSDYQLKKDIKTEENLLARIKDLTPVNYYFKQDEEKTGLILPTELQHGFIAQELETVFPELIRETLSPIFDKNNNQTGTFKFKSVNYTELISILVGAVKELSAEVDDLKEFKALQSKKIDETTGLDSFSLQQNVPNPFSTQTSISYSLPEGNRSSSIFITDLTGQLIKEYKLTSTKGQIIVDGTSLKKGIYIYALISDNKEMITKKLIFN